jgi:TonB family protein
MCGPSRAMSTSHKSRLFHTCSGHLVAKSFLVRTMSIVSIVLGSTMLDCAETSTSRRSIRLPDSTLLILPERRGSCDFDYPVQALDAGESGVVELNISVNADGRVTSAKVSKGVSPALDEAALKSIYKCRFDPATKTGVVTPVTNLKYRFIFEYGVSTEEAKTILGQIKDRVIDCQRDELKRTPELAGKIVTSFLIGPNGRVLRAEVTETTIHNRSVEECVLELIRGLTFPIPADVTTFGFDKTWVFSHLDGNSDVGVIPK